MDPNSADRVVDKEISSSRCWKSSGLPPFPSTPPVCLQGSHIPLCHRKFAAIPVEPGEAASFRRVAASGRGVVDMIGAIRLYPRVNRIKFFPLPLRDGVKICKPGRKVNRNFATSLK